MIELVGWFVMTLATMFGLIVLPFLVGPAILWTFALYVVAIADIRALFVFEVPNTHRSTAEKAVAFALAPIYGLLHVTLLVWLRAYALCALRRGTWGTRAKVEVALRSDEYEPAAWGARAGRTRSWSPSRQPPGRLVAHR